MATDSLCASCGYYKVVSAVNPNLPPKGSSKPKYYLVGERPTQNDDRVGNAWSGVLAKETVAQLQGIGVDLKECRWYNAVCCAGAQSKKKEETKICSKRVRNDIDLHRPERVIALGSEAIMGLFPNFIPAATTAFTVRGRIVPYFLDKDTPIPVLLTFSPVAAIESKNKGGTDADTWTKDFQKFAALDVEEWRRQIKESRIDEPNITLCHQKDKVAECFNRLKTEKVTAFDFETLGLQLYKHPENETGLFSVAFAFDNGDAYAIPMWNAWNPEFLKQIKAGLRKWAASNMDQLRIMHTKFEMHCLLSQVRESEDDLFHFGGRWEDTALMSALLDERRTVNRLKVAASLHLGHPDWSVDVKDVRKLPLNEVLTYNALDAVRTLELFRYLSYKIAESPRMKRVYEELLFPACEQFTEIEVRGTCVDMDLLKSEAVRMTAELEEINREIKNIVGNPDFNPGSPKQVQEYFVNEKGYILLKRTKTGFSVDEEALTYVKDEYGDKVAELLIDYKKLQKMNSTYVSGLIPKVFSDNKLHGVYNVVAAATGRTSSDAPNMQNFPKRKGKEIRKVIVPPPGKKLVSFDYGQIEARLFAAATADPTYYSFLMEKKDTHLEVAKMVFGEERAAEHRQVCKNGVFAMLYGASDKTVAATIGASIEEIAQLRKGFFGNFKKFADWQKEVARNYSRDHYVESISGRRRNYPLSYMELLNSPIQATASDMTLYSMTLLNRKFDVAFMIHDDISFYLPDDNTLEDNVLYIMEAMLTLPWWLLSESPYLKTWVPLAVECAVGDNWADMVDVEKVDALDFGYTGMESTLEKACSLREELLRTEKYGIRS